MASRGLVFVPDTAAAAASEAAAAADPSNAVARTFRFTTSPLINVVEEINQRSQNLHAELTLRHLGKLAKGAGSAAAGLAGGEGIPGIARAWTPAEFILRDGCGLSHDNRVKPRAMAMLLAKMARHRYVNDYISSLASPGMDGATGRRLRPLMQSGLIRYKTGSISQVQGLSGYAFGIDGDTLAVALFINGFRGSSEAASRLMDSLFVRVASWYNKERPALVDAHKLLSRKDMPKDYLGRLTYFSAALQERPYFLGPTGEGRFGLIEPKPLADLSRFDCVTYIESAMALAQSRGGPRPAAAPPAHPLPWRRRRLRHPQPLLRGGLAQAQLLPGAPGALPRGQPGAKAHRQDQVLPGPPPPRPRATPPSSGSFPCRPRIPWPNSPSCPMTRPWP